MDPQPRSGPSLAPRQSSDQPSTTIPTVVAVVVIGIFVLGLVVGGLAIYRRRTKSAQHRRLVSTDDSELQLQQTETAPTVTRPRQESNATTAANVAHRLSTRSVGSIMTLPPYKETPGEAEEIIAREGEREGLDYIIEGPETAEEREERRQEEVAAIYRVQLTRRRELEERAERRRARRAAVESQDYREVARLDRAAGLARQREQQNTSTTTLGQESQASRSSTTVGANALDAVVEGAEPSSGTLLAELQQIRSRGRRVSSVTYADLGVQRHDGSRLRAESTGSDSQPLLDAAGNMGRISADFRSGRSRASSVASNGNANELSRPDTSTTLDPTYDPSLRTPGRERSRSRASRPGVSEDMLAVSRQLSEDGIPPEPPSYEDDLSVHAGDVPRYEDIVVDGPADSSPGGHLHPDAEVHEEQAHDLPRQAPPVERNLMPQPSGLPLRLQTGSVPTPSIEVVSATPTSVSRPETPLTYQPTGAVRR